MKNKFLKNVCYSFLEKGYTMGIQFLISFFLIRVLSREDYGIIGIIAGYFTLITCINISIESIILRDNSKISQNPKYYFDNFFAFNVIKNLILFGVSCLTAVFLSILNANINYFYAMGSITVISIADNFVSPYMVYSTAQFKQSVVTKQSGLRYTLNFILTLGIFFFPSLKYIFYKDVIVSVCYVLSWVSYFQRVNKILIWVKRDNVDKEYIVKSLKEYSIWIHLNGVVTNFIYKSDTMFLSLFISEKMIGDYNVALNAANVANMIPMILAYQNSAMIANARTDEEANRITNKLIKVSFILGFGILVIYVIFGKLYLRIVTGEREVETIYRYMIPIVIGLIIVKTIASPLNSFVNIKSSVSGLFKETLLPVMCIVCITYFIAAYLGGPQCVAYANIINSVCWLVLIIRYVGKKGYRWKSV